MDVLSDGVYVHRTSTEGSVRSGKKEVKLENKCDQVRQRMQLSGVIVALLAVLRSEPQIYSRLKGFTRMIISIKIAWRVFVHGPQPLSAWTNVKLLCDRGRSEIDCMNPYRHSLLRPRI